MAIDKTAAILAGSVALMVAGSCNFNDYAKKTTLEKCFDSVRANTTATAEQKVALTTACGNAVGTGMK